MRVLVVGLLLLLPLLAGAQAPSKDGPAPPKDVSSLLRLGHKWVKTDQKLVDSGEPVTTKVMLDHFAELHALRVAFERLERRGELNHLGEGRRVSLRHLLAQILGSALQVDGTSGVSGDRLAEAKDQNREDVQALTELASRVFDFSFDSSKE